MQKAEVVQRLRQFAEEEYLRKGAAILAQYLAYWLEKTELGKYTHDSLTWIIEPYLSVIVFDALHDLRTSDDDMAVLARSGYEKQSGYPVLNISVLGQGLETSRYNMVSDLGDLLSEVVGDPNYRREFARHCDAEWAVLHHEVKIFTREVYRRGLFDIIEAGSGGMKATFGSTTMLTIDSTGKKIMRLYMMVEGQEIDLSIYAEDSDSYGLTTNVRYTIATLPEALEMIREVIAGWPADPDEQKALLVPNPDVKFSHMK